MKIVEVLVEASPASIKRTLKTINKLNVEIEQVREKGKSPKVAKVKELNRLESAFLRMTGTSFDEYERQQLASKRMSPEEMIELVKTVDLQPGTSENLLASEAGEGALLMHVLRDITPQLPDDVANAMSDFLQKPHVFAPDSDQRMIASAVAQRAIELGVVDAYKEKQVEKLDKDKMKFDYDKEVDLDEDGGGLLGYFFRKKTGTSGTRGNWLKDKIIDKVISSTKEKEKKKDDEEDD